MLICRIFVIKFINFNSEQLPKLDKNFRSLTNSMLFSKPFPTFMKSKNNCLEAYKGLRNILLTHITA